MSTVTALARGEKPTVRDIQEDIEELLTKLEKLVPVVSALTTSNRRGLGVLTYEAREALDRQTRIERTELRSHPKRYTDDGKPKVGLEWLNHQLVTTLGPRPAPGNFRSIAVDADMWFTLWHQVRRITRVMEASGIPVPPDPRVARTDRPVNVIELRPAHRPAGFVGPMPSQPTIVAAEDQPTIFDLIDRLSTLVKAAPSMSLLRPVRRELQALWEQADVVAEGARTVFLDDCPWCQRPTLHLFRREDLVRCDRPRGSKHYKPCVCADPLCQCRTDPIGFRHTWKRSDNEYQSLKGRLTFIRRLKEPNQMTAAQAKQAIANVRALHRPDWTQTLEDGTEVRQEYVVLVDGPGDDHMCRTDGVGQCDPDNDLHYALACLECGSHEDETGAVFALWPCPTDRALSGVDVAGEREALAAAERELEEAERLAAEEAASAADQQGAVITGSAFHQHGAAAPDTSEEPLS